MQKYKTAAILFVLFYSINIYTQSKFEDALFKASSENKKIIVDVYTDWCTWCKKMDKEVYANKDIKKLIEDNFIFVKLNAEGKEKINYNGKKYTEEELSYFFDVFSFPTTLFLESDGKLITFKYDNYPMKNIPGYFKADEFKKILEFFKNEKYKDSDLSTVL
jgi:thioredoxin-related protein